MTSLIPISEVQLSARNAAGELRRHVLDYIRRNQPAPGSRLSTEAELVRSLKISRSTVRRALGPLERDGWIDRRAGSGTYVGRRVKDLLNTGETPASGSNGPFATSRKNLAPQTSDTAPRARVLRVAVLVFNIGDLAHDWYTPLVLEGLDEAAEEFGISVELVGNREGDVDAISRRLQTSQPDVLACLSADPKQALVIRDAQRMGIHCFVTGTPHAGLGVPSISEDNRQTIRLGVDYLMQKGHRRIGLVLPREAAPWVFERHEAFMQAMHRPVDVPAPGAASLGHENFESPESFVHWLPIERQPDDGPMVDAVERFVRERRLTAVIPGAYLPMRCIDTLARSRRLRVPDEVSVLNMEQDWQRRRWMGIARPTSLALPLKAMGRRLAELARDASDGRVPAERSVLPALVLDGSSVKALNTDARAEARIGGD